MKKQLPPFIQKEMKAWREGEGLLPKSYIEFHQKLASESINVLSKENNIEIHKVALVDDGWFDGMKVLSVICEYKNKLFKLKWSDSNQEWMIRIDCGGYGTFRLEDL